MTLLALRYMGDGEFRASHPRLADKALVVGEVLRWEVVSERSAESHRHLFALIADYWDSLPDALASEFPSPKHLRKWALCEIGHCTITALAFANNQEAMRAAILLKELDSYVQIGVNDKAVVVKCPKSMAYMAVRQKKEFQELKDKVLHVISALIGADIAESKGAA